MCIPHFCKLPTSLVCQHQHTTVYFTVPFSSSVIGKPTLNGTVPYLVCGKIVFENCMSKEGVGLSVHLHLNGLSKD